jgi:hypothetical protein
MKNLTNRLAKSQSKRGGKYKEVDCHVGVHKRKLTRKQSYKRDLVLKTTKIVLKLSSVRYFY